MTFKVPDNHPIGSRNYELKELAMKKIGQCPTCGESLTIDHKCGPLYDKKSDQKVYTREQVEELWSYAHHDSWRCNYYGKCHCGLDDLCKKMGLELHPMKAA